MLDLVVAWLLVQLPLLMFALGWALGLRLGFLFCLGLGFGKGSLRPFPLGRTWAGLAVVCGICLGLDLGWLGLTWFLGLCLYMTL